MKEPIKHVGRLGKQADCRNLHWAGSLALKPVYSVKPQRRRQHSKYWSQTDCFGGVRGEKQQRQLLAISKERQNNSLSKAKVSSLSELLIQISAKSFVSLLVSFFIVGVYSCFLTYPIQLLHFKAFYSWILNSQLLFISGSFEMVVLRNTFCLTN